MRLKEPPAESLVRSAYARETGDMTLLYSGMSLADIAHVVGLIEANIVPADAGGALLYALLTIHPRPPLDFALDPATGDVYSNREAYLKMLAAPVGWLSAGRARREATTIGYRLAARARLLTLSAALADCAAAALDLADAHRATLFPDYTYLQPAQPTTFGHYLLTFVYPILRDLDRARDAFARTNLSPAGSGSVNGSRLPLDRERLANLLGFDGVITHTRDAMWQADGPIEIAALITAALVNLDRLAEDLQIFSTSEFGLLDLADRHTRTSVIMPQKKNPYSLAYIRGACGEAIGTLAAMAAVGKTPSGQIDNRLFAYGDIPRALDQTTGAIRLMADVLRGLTVNAARAAGRAAQNFIGATDLAEVMMLKCGMDYKTAHDLVGHAVRAAIETGSPTLTADLLEAASQSHLQRSLDLDPALVAEALDPARIVAVRSGVGGAAESSAAQMIADCRESLTHHDQWRAAAQLRIESAEAMLLMTASALKIAPPQPAESAPEFFGDEWDESYGDLPVPPNRRRRFGV